MSYFRVKQSDIVGILFKILQSLDSWTDLCTRILKNHKHVCSFIIYYNLTLTKKDGNLQKYMYTSSHLI